MQESTLLVTLKDPNKVGLPDLATRLINEGFAIKATEVSTNTLLMTVTSSKYYIVFNTLKHIVNKYRDNCPLVRYVLFVTTNAFIIRHISKLLIPIEIDINN